MRDQTTILVITVGGSAFSLCGTDLPVDLYLQAWFTHQLYLKKSVIEADQISLIELR